MALKMLSYCERVYADGQSNVRLISKALVDNHVPDFDTLIKLENECLQFNFDFFAQGKVLDFLNKGLSLARIESFRNIDGFIGQIIVSGRATLHELRTIYTLEDAMDMYEAEAVTKYNEYLISKASMKEK